jgi:hypothetical protein
MGVYHNLKYNGLIRSFQIAYIKQCVTFGKVLKKLIENEVPIVKQDLIIGAVSLTYIVLVFVWSVYTLKKNR